MFDDWIGYALNLSDRFLVSLSVMSPSFVKIR